MFIWKNYWTRVQLPPSPPKNGITAESCGLFFDFKLEEQKRIATNLCYNFLNLLQIKESFSTKIEILCKI